MVAYIVRVPVVEFPGDRAIPRTAFHATCVTARKPSWVGQYPCAQEGTVLLQVHAHDPETSSPRVDEHAIVVDEVRR